MTTTPPLPPMPDSEEARHAQWRELMDAFDRYRAVFGRDDITLFALLDAADEAVAADLLNRAVARGRRTNDAELGEALGRTKPLPPGAVI